MCINNDENVPLVSIVMPAYNAERFIEEAITSVINQTLTDWELIVIDDCSSDKTAETVADLVKHDNRIRLVKNEKNLGVAKTRNRGLDICTGNFIALLDSDDYWKPAFLEKMIHRAKKSEVDIVYCSYELVDEHNQKVCNDFIVPEKTTFDESIVRSVITCSTVLMTAETAQNRFPTDMYHEDIALWFQLLREGKIARGVPEILAAYRQRNDSRSSGKFRSACRRWVIYRKYLKLSLLKSVVTMAKYGYYGLIKFKRI